MSQATRAMLASRHAVAVGVGPTGRAPRARRPRGPRCVHQRRRGPRRDAPGRPRATSAPGPDCRRLSCEPPARGSDRLPSRRLARPAASPARRAPSPSPRRTRAEDQAFEQRVAGQSIGAVNAACRPLRRPRTGPAMPVRPCKIGVDAAAQIVRRGAHRQPIARKVEPGPRAGLRDAGKALAHPRRIQVRQRQVHRTAGPLGLAHHRRGHDVARRQIAPADRTAS